MTTTRTTTAWLRWRSSPTPTCPTPSPPPRSAPTPSTRRAICRTSLSNVATPTYLADRAAAIAAEAGNIEFEVHDREWIENKGMGAFAAVAKGTPEEPRLIVMRYNGAPDSDAPTLGFVGKAVTFDTGGISLKPSGKMEEMKFDMSGGAAVLEATGAIAKLGLPVNLISVVPSTENMPGGRATKPGDIVTALNGKTIEIDNTDAEGRLILADALTYANELGADRLVNLATLTGAIIVALGSTYAGLFSNDDEWAAQVRGRRRQDRRARPPSAAAPGVRGSDQGQVRGHHERARQRARGRRSRLPSS